ncbi:hypothetical protein EV44_g2207 [Erysiphe necator]|uniref:Uncharacterized protein n=1 Tax=Uncinula necator TaxID=52586 RepID=A0A0B1P8E1_UNCNE|nr:hypothetical protein EV44_g2207 [Erysiphe necator]
MVPSTRRGKRPLEESPQATQSVAPNPSYSQPLQGVANLAPPLSQPLSAATSPPLGIEIESDDPFCTPISNTPPGTFTAVLDRGTADRKTARITQEKTVKLAAKAPDNILSDVKKDCPESVDGFENLLLSAIEDLAAACPITIGAKSPETQHIPRPFHKSQPSTKTTKNSYAEILKNICIYR